jgi:hypothetical protein
MEKYIKNEQLIDGSLDDNQVMMHIEKGKYFGLNPVGKRIWEILDQPKSLQEIIAKLMIEFKVSEEQCTQDVKIFIDRMVKFDLIAAKEFDS